jgi:hypothetical protein
MMMTTMVVTVRVHVVSPSYDTVTMAVIIKKKPVLKVTYGGDCACGDTCEVEGHVQRG